MLRFPYVLIIACLMDLRIYKQSSKIEPLSSTVSTDFMTELNSHPEHSGYLSELMLNMPNKRTFKWIVVTSSINSSKNVMKSEGIKILSSYPEWTLVVVGDKETSHEWNHTDVHYLSFNTQAAMDFESVNILPEKDYTRKNAGYLYAIANGAKWIYDADLNIVPYGKGLEQFQFGAKARGLRFSTPERRNSTIQDSLFNPFRHFGRSDMLPKGFPLEYAKNHEHHEGSYRLCRVQKPPVVQQGMIHNNVDGDSISHFRDTDSVNGLDEAFSEFAPPIILSQGMYAPWNSQNTLFSRKAFFGLFLPVTASFRASEILRSYFTQALLHAAGESMSFVPANAKRRNNAYMDMNGESLYNAGAIVEFIKQWRCTHDKLDRCAIQLATEFSTRGFWEEQETYLVSLWIADLRKIGYTFPYVRPNYKFEYSIGKEEDVRRNCRHAHCFILKVLYPSRRAHISFESRHVEKHEDRRSINKINDFSYLKDWCDGAQSNRSKGWLFPAPSRLSQETRKNGTLINNYKTVAIITNNFNWRNGMGLLKRMYEAHFGMLIFCGHYPQNDSDSLNTARREANFPNLELPINYIDLSEEEVHRGFLMYYCLSKVEELNLQNIKGYFMFSDDMIFNFWNPLNFNMTQMQHPHFGGIGNWWWDKEFGFNAMKRAIHLFTGKYRNDDEVARFVTVLKEATRKNQPNEVTPYKYLMKGDGTLIGDWMYISTSNLQYVAMFAQIAHEAKLFHELFTAMIMGTLPGGAGNSDHPVRVQSLWSSDRSRWGQFYEGSLHGLHPVKLSEFVKIRERAQFCDLVLDKFYRNIFRIGM